MMTGTTQEGEGSDSDDYLLTQENATLSEPTPPAFADVYSEPADPSEVDHDRRSEQRIAPNWFDTDRLPSPLVECGCNGCPERYDPLADEDSTTGAFSDVLDRSKMAADECPEPQPMTVERAGRAYYVYQTAKRRRDDWVSALEKTVSQHGRYLDGERDLLTERWDDVTTALLSLRPRPVGEPPQSDDSPDDGETDTVGRASSDDYYPLTSEKTTPSENNTPSETPSDGSADTEDDKQRRWRHPVTIDLQLHTPIEKVRERLRYQLEDFEWSYVWLVSGTDSAATPHLHWLVYVEDPDDEITTDHFESAIEAFVEECHFADESDHLITDDEMSDAVIVQTDPTHCDEIDDEQLLNIIDERGDDPPFSLNTAALTYMLNQRPHWVLKRLHDGEQDLDEQQTQIDMQAGAIAWASPAKWLQASNDFPA